MENDKIYVAIGKEVEERETILRWVFKNFAGKTICVIYVHVPSKRIPLTLHSVKENELEAFRAQERENVLQLLDDCNQICAKFQVPCESTFVERDSITDGILELINQLRIENLVMAASSNNKYVRRGMTTLMSEKAKKLLQSAPDFCHIWFICKDLLIYKREGVMNQSPNVEKINNQSVTGIVLGQVSVTSLINLYNNNLQQAVPEAECSRREAFRKSVSRWNAEKQAMEVIRKAKPVGRLYYKDHRPNKGMKEEAEDMKSMYTKVSVDLHEALDQKLSLEREIENFNLKVKELEEKLVSEVKLSQKYKTELKLQIERESAQCSSSMDPMFSEFSYMELQEATNGFDPSLKIGEGAYGSMYKGFLHHTEVAIKLLVFNCVQNHQEFNEQVHCISKLRHPNLVTLIGACREPWALVYEYLPNGPLIDQLIRQNDNTPPLPWQMRIRIAIDICSALIFLHSSNPTCTAQSDLTPIKLLLDANFSCKITDFSVFSNRTASTNLIITRLLKPIAGPDSVKAGNIESDVYSFGIIVLQLLTGNPATLGIVKKVKYALNAGALDRVMDPLAGEWPFVQAQQLAHMAVRCCDLNSNKRPDLASDVWKVLAPMRASCSSLSSRSMVSHDNPPHYFICPILQETMEDPHFAADGFTYEAEAIRGWFDSGHDTSPMTNMKLTSRNLTPNRSLRSVIQEWLQSTSTK